MPLSISFVFQNLRYILLVFLPHFLLRLFETVRIVISILKRSDDTLLLASYLRIESESFLRNGDRVFQFRDGR